MSFRAIDSLSIATGRSIDIVRIRACVLGLVAACGSDSPQPVAKQAVPSSVVAPAEPPPAPPAKQEPAPPPEHVVIFSIDGLRPDMMTVDLMPRHVQLMAEGITATHASTI